MKQSGLQLLFALGVSVPALAQSPPGGGYSLPSVKPIEWPAGLSAPSSFEDAYLGSFGGDFSADGAILGDSQAFLLYGIEYHASVIPVSPSGVDVDAIAPVVPAEPADPWTLAMATADGIYGYTHPGPASLIVSGSPWNALTHLRPAKLDTYGNGDLIAASASAVYLLHHDGSGWSSGATISATGTILDVAQVDWNGDGDEEVAVLDTLGVLVYETDGTLLDYFYGPASSGSIAPIAEMDGYSTGRLAWSFPSGANQLLLVCSPGGGRINCGAFPDGAAAIATGTFVDPTGFRRVDLVATTPTKASLRYFLHNPSGNPFDATAPDGFEVVGSSSPFGSCRIAFTDVSGDKVPDVLFGRPGDGTAYFLPGTDPLFAGAPSEKLSLPPFVDPRLRVEWDQVWFQTHLKFQNAGGFANVQLRLWRSDDGEVLDHEEVNNTIFEINSYPKDHVWLAQLPGSPDADMRIMVPLTSVEDECDLLGGQGYYFTMRLVNLDANDVVTSYGATIDAGFTCYELVAEEMDDVDLNWLDLAHDFSCHPTGLAPGIVKNPIWARLDPNATPDYAIQDVNPTIPGDMIP